MINKLSERINLSRVLENIGLPRSTYYYWKNQKDISNSGSRKTKNKPSWSLSNKERQTVLNIMNSEEYCDMSPAQIYHSLLDKDEYFCSIRTMYRILSENNQIKERRQRRSSNYIKPELLAISPNQVWSWDITKLKSVLKWTYYYLYVILDIYSRYIVGWLLAYRENSDLAKQLIYETCLKQNIARDQLTIHADHGSSMRSKPVAFLLSDLGITKTHSRPYQSNDNPYSESQFKTLKYHPTFPDRFNSIEEARTFCSEFFNWYNNNFYHSGLGYYTPYSVHYGTYGEIYLGREKALEKAFSRTPLRFKNGVPKPKKVPDCVWINKPKDVNN
jgi:putative transposase